MMVNREDEDIRLVPLTGLQIAHLAGLLANAIERPDPRMADEFYQWQKERLCQLEEQMHDLRNQVNPLALWAAQQRVRERRDG